MSRFEVVPFEKEMIHDAGRLLAQRHRSDRATLPDLPAGFESPDAAATAISATLEEPGATGVAAVRDSQLLGYMLGRPTIDATWGRSAWVRPAGCATDPAETHALVRSMYAALAAPWVDEGIFFHFALMPLADGVLLDAWYSLSFGIEQVQALQSLALVDPAPPRPPAGVEIRRAGPDDKDALRTMSSVIWRHQVQAPVWGIMLPEVVPEQEDGWAELVDEEDVVVYLAFVNGQIAGVQAYWPAESTETTLLVPAGTAYMSVGGTLPAFRRRASARPCRVSCWPRRALPASAC
ncbi:MAG: hypothetical protein R2844_21765 [Caldilineales bacterium]